MSDSGEGGRVSENWSVPPELRHPTASVVSNLVIVMISSEMLGNDIIAAVGELQAESARFNKYCGGVGMQSLSGAELSRRNSEATKLVREVFEAWMAFCEKFEAGQRKRWVAVDERAALHVALIDAKRGLAALQESLPA